MNVHTPAWASCISKARQPLSSGLRTAFEPKYPLPADFQLLLARIDRARRAAERLDH